MQNTNWRYGLFLALCCIMLWGILPIVLKIVLKAMDAYTITWFRFLLASVVTAGILVRKEGFPKTTRRDFIAMLIASLGLCANYILFLQGLHYTSPNTAQVVIQLAPMFLLFGSMIFFQERFSARQWVGFATLLCGLLLFFNRRLQELFSQRGDYTLGVIFIVLAAITWAMYALLQKKLQKTYSSQQIMWFVYTTGVVVFFPSCNFSIAYQLDSLQWSLLVFCAFNTIASYGCFAESLNHWEASRISMILSLTPLLTLLFGFIAFAMFPKIVVPEAINALSVVGIFLVVLGSIFNVLARR